MNRFVNFMGRILDKIRIEWQDSDDVWKLFLGIQVCLACVVGFALFAVLCYSLAKHPLTAVMAGCSIAYWILEGGKKDEG